MYFEGVLSVQFVLCDAPRCETWDCSDRSPLLTLQCLPAGSFLPVVLSEAVGQELEREKFRTKGVYLFSKLLPTFKKPE